jgi:hypothetical protein
VRSTVPTIFTFREFRSVLCLLLPVTSKYTVDPSFRVPHSNSLLSPSNLSHLLPSVPHYGHLAVQAAITSSIYAALNADLSSPPNAYVVCSLVFTSAIITYMVDGISINVPLSQLNTPNRPERPFTKCPLNFQTASAGKPVVLGDSFLSSAYVVFDLDNEQASLAPTNFNSTTSNILQITT